MKELLKTLSNIIDFKRPLPSHCLICQNAYHYNEKAEYGCRNCRIIFSTLHTYPMVDYSNVRFIYNPIVDCITVFHLIGGFDLKNKMNSYQDSYLRRMDLERAEKIALLI